jgi:hypothetical protein
MPDDEGKKFVTEAELNAAIGDVIDKFCRLRKQPRKFDLPEIYTQGDITEAIRR